MKATELREMTDVELNKQLKDLKAELFNLALSARHQPVGQPHSYRDREEGHRPCDDRPGREECQKRVRGRVKHGT